MKLHIRKIILPVVTAIGVLSFAIPSFAYSSISASTTVSFSKYSTYYKGKGTGKITASGSSETGQRIENTTILQCEAYMVDDVTETDDDSPVTVTITSDREVDGMYWQASTTGELWDGELIDIAEDDDEEYISGY
ncbi:hypothetical protein [Brevibacillus migulae]|uniref:hypothetical protein n=1 Tax=Brevibacillus migulae TaxID=1644114 RepID=UPI00106EBDC8|nr:hypothetical protein [Brevibacillus migulae]